MRVAVRMHHQPQRVPNGGALSIRSHAPFHRQRAAAHRAALRKICAARENLDRYRSSATLRYQPGAKSTNKSEVPEYERKEIIGS